MKLYAVNMINGKTYYCKDYNIVKSIGGNLPNRLIQGSGFYTGEFNNTNKFTLEGFFGWINPSFIVDIEQVEYEVE